MTSLGQLRKFEYRLYFALGNIQTLEFLECDNDIAYVGEGHCF